MFEQHERWLEELKAHLDRAESVTSRSGYLHLVAIVSEIVDADADERKQTSVHIPNWESLAVDLRDTHTYLGPELHDQVQTNAIALATAIDDLIQTKDDEDGKPRKYIDEDRRPEVRKHATLLFEQLDDDDVMVAAWRDLVTGCRSGDFVAYTHDRIAFLRDTVVGLQTHRRQDSGHWGTLTTACNVLFGGRVDISEAQKHVGEQPVEIDPKEQDVPSGLAVDERIALSERYIVTNPPKQDVVVWLRIANAFVPRRDCVEYGDITFYAAQVLAGAIIDHAAARAMFSVVPEELLTDRTSAAQSDPERVNEYSGFEHKPALVYARVVVKDVEAHRAEDVARTYLATVLALGGPESHTWTVLNGALIFDGKSRPRELEWGPKRDLAPTLFPQNDYMADCFAELREQGHLINREVANALLPVINLKKALEATPLSDSEGVVMASVRAIEHCNAWTTRGRKPWGKFITAYLLDEATRIDFLERAREHTFHAIAVTRPDRSPGAAPEPELDAIASAVDDQGRGREFDLRIAIEHLSTLKDIYKDHPLLRPLSELVTTLESGASIGHAVDREKDRVRARLARLTRSRNAAIHGGPLSSAACDSIADFAQGLAMQALHSVAQAIIEGEPIPDFMQRRREDSAHRIAELRRTGDRSHWLPEPKEANE